MDILIIGGGSRAKVLMDLLEREGRHRVVGHLLDPAVPIEAPLDLPALGRLEDLPAIADRLNVSQGIIAINDVGQRMAAVQRIHALMPAFTYVSAVDPAAIVSNGVQLGAGSVVLAGARIEPDVTIGEHAFIGARAVIGADSSLGSFSSVSAGATIGEACHVGSGSAIGMNAALVERTVVGTHCVVTPGAMVLESVPDLHVAEASPARCTRTRLVGERYR